jgi:hypothetical protein
VVTRLLLAEPTNADAAAFVELLKRRYRAEGGTGMWVWGGIAVGLLVVAGVVGYALWRRHGSGRDAASAVSRPTVRDGPVAAATPASALAATWRPLGGRTVGR